jgi:NAD(P)-dependent dehydrogenase (short-subunit alcohol dehydrogenase family)
VLAAIERDQKQPTQLRYRARHQATDAESRRLYRRCARSDIVISTTASIPVLGGMARDWPYSGSTTITMANGAVTSMVRSLAVELAPVRVNAIHPGAVGDSLAVKAMPPAMIEGIRTRTPTGRLIT